MDDRTSRLARSNLGFIRTRTNIRNGFQKPEFQAYFINRGLPKLEIYEIFDKNLIFRNFGKNYNFINWGGLLTEGGGYFLGAN